MFCFERSHLAFFFNHLLISTCKHFATLKETQLLSKGIIFQKDKTCDIVFHISLSICSYLHRCGGRSKLIFFFLQKIKFLLGYEKCATERNHVLKVNFFHAVTNIFIKYLISLEKGWIFHGDVAKSKKMINSFKRG